jgi:hypothetical protein
MAVVIDALDECDDKELMAEFIEVVTNACQELRRFPFRIFFTSRVEEHIRKKLETPGARSAMYPLALPDFDVHDDIRTFFQSRFAAIYEENHRVMRNVPLPWPSHLDLEALVEKASGSFIFAFTLINFIDDGSDAPHRKLPIALRAHAGLDPLYTQVLSAAPRGQNLQRVISTIMLLMSPLSITALAHLLQLDTAEILQALLVVQSILMIPGDDDHPVQLFHTSLRDFLTTQSRSGGFFIDPTTHHITITANCLEVMNALPGDDVFHGEIQEYACNNWCCHFYLALREGGHNFFNSLSGSLVACIMDFVSQSFDFWFNTLICSGQWPNMLEVLHSIVLLLEVGLWFYCFLTLKCLILFLLASTKSPI